MVTAAKEVEKFGLMRGHVFFDSPRWQNVIPFEKPAAVTEDVVGAEPFVVRLCVLLILISFVREIPFDDAQARCDRAAHPLVGAGDQLLDACRLEKVLLANNCRKPFMSAIRLIW